MVPSPRLQRLMLLWNVSYFLSNTTQDLPHLLLPPSNLLADDSKDELLFIYQNKLIYIYIFKLLVTFKTLEKGSLAY